MHHAKSIMHDTMDRASLPFKVMPESYNSYNLCHKHVIFALHAVLID